MVTETVRFVANVPKDVAEQATQIAAQMKMSRSRLITECLLKMIQERQNELLAEGYDAMAERHRESARMTENTIKEVVRDW